MKTIFITVAAQGIGLAAARHFAKQGGFWGLYDINQEGLDLLVNNAGVLTSIRRVNS